MERDSHWLLDLCCDLQSQKKILPLLRCLLLGLPALAFVVAIVLLLLRFAVTPQVKAYVEDARLNSFVFANRSASATTATSLEYNISISVALILRNPNGAMELKHTKPLVATFLFDDRRLYNVTVANEGHKHRPLRREVHLLHTGGEVPYVLDIAAVEQFKMQNATGVFKLEMRLSGEITLGIGNNRGLELSCLLTLQRQPPGPDIVVFHEVDCTPDKPKKIVF
jgi:hypothetical protein